MKSAYPASANLDLARCRHLSIDDHPSEATDATELAEELNRLQEIERELSLAQRWVQGRLADVQRELEEILGEDTPTGVSADVLAAVAAGAHGPSEIAQEIDIPEYVVESVLADLADRGLIAETVEGYSLTA